MDEQSREMKHTAIMCCYRRLISAIEDLEILVNRIQGTNPEPRGKTKTEDGSATSLLEVLDTLGSQLETATERIQKATEIITANLF